MRSIGVAGDRLSLATAGSIEVLSFKPGRSVSCRDNFSGTGGESDDVH